MARQQSKYEDPPDETFQINPAVRCRVPQIIFIHGPTFSGKTYGALLLASGLVEPGGKIGFIDTENGRGAAYADDPDIRRVIPAGYNLISLHPPFHPKRYIGALNTFERAGYGVTIIDSGSHGWDGDGGCLEIKEQTGNWLKAKLWSKRFKTALIYSQMHVIVCLRAQDKTKITEVGGKQQYSSLGILPICEKNLTFDAGCVFSVEGEIDGQLATHLSRPMKWPKAMNGLFDNWKPQLLTPEIGTRIREWNNGAASGDPWERLRQRARVTAQEGIESYQGYFGSLRNDEKKVLIDSGAHAENKSIAQAAVVPDDDANEDQAGDFITPAQASNLWRVGMADGHKSKAQIEEIVTRHGFPSVNEITPDKHEEILNELLGIGKPTGVAA